MEKLVLHSSERGLVSQVLSKTYNPWETCKYSSTTDLLNVEKHQVELYHLRVLSKIFLRNNFKTPTVDNLLHSQNYFITFVISYE